MLRLHRRVARDRAYRGPAGVHAGLPAVAQALQAAKEFFEQTQHDPTFHDIHAWQFTPSSFRLIVNDLHAIGYVALREQPVLLGTGEFFVAMSSVAGGPDVDRLQLAQQAIAESRDITVLSGA